MTEPSTPLICSTPAERLTAAWFGPKGFASVVYALLILDSDLPSRETVLALVTAAVLVSVVAHASTDVLVANALRPTPAV